MNHRLRLDPAIMAAIFWGSLLGFCEATVGFIIHSLPRIPGTASLVLVPFALYCFYSAARSAGARGVIVATATAAGIKLVDFLLPALTPLSVINPAVALCFEGLSFYAIARVLRWPARRVALPVLAVAALTVNLLWRALFLAYSAILLNRGTGEFLSNGNRNPLDFLLRDAVLSTAVVLVPMVLTRPSKAPVPAARFKPWLVFGMCFLALAAELASRLA